MDNETENITRVTIYCGGIEVGSVHIIDAFCTPDVKIVAGGILRDEATTDGDSKEITVHITQVQ